MKHSIALILLTVGLTGCATFQPKPLNTASTLTHEVPHLTVDAAQMPLPELAAHRFDLSDGLDMTEVAMLAVVNNPDLKLARDDAKIGAAQAFAAGLLPNPQLTVSGDFPSSGGTGVVNGFLFGLSYDVNALLTRSATKAAARADQRKLDLNLLWQEWQMVSQARLFFVRSISQVRLMQLLQENKALLATRVQQMQAALKAGNQTLNEASNQLAALAGVERQVNDLERQISQNLHDLNDLLGLAPDVKLALAGDTALPDLDDIKVAADLANLVRCRPDLQALQAGYASQDQRFRQAILAQFPALNIGLNRARDTSNLYTQGIGITLILPIFNHNQGNIAIEEATRQRLYDEFQVRLNTAYSQIDRLQIEQALLEEQLKKVQADGAQLQEVTDKADAALQAGNMDSLTYTNLRVSLLDKRREAITLEQSILEQSVALQTLIGNCRRNGA